MTRNRCTPLPALAALALIAVGCAVNPVTGGRDFVLMSEAQEIALGRQYHDEIVKQYGREDNAELQSYVDDIGQRLAARSHRPQLDYHVTVLDSPQINAFALPGGYIYVTRGIMAYFNSEAELAGVLGHELGHVTARHGVRQQSAATATGVLGAILIVGTGAGAGAADLFQTLQVAAIRGYGREHELEADRLGAEYLARAGYDPERMLDVVMVLADQEDYERRRAEAEGREPSAYHGLFATHPRNDQRRQEVIRAARKHRIDQPRPDGRDEYLRHLEGTVFGSSAAQGKVIDHHFLHLELDATLAAPDNWRIANLPDRLVFRAPDDDAQLVVRLGNREGKSARELLEGRIPVDRLTSTNSVSAGDYRGYTGVTVETTPVGSRSIRHTVVTKDDQAWIFAAAARDEGRFQHYDPRFLDIARSLRPLNEEQRRQARPLRIQVIRAPAGTTFARLARDVPPEVEDPEGQLRLLNAAWPQGEPEAGQLVKTLRH